MPTATKLSPKKPTRRRVTKKISASIVKAAKDIRLARQEDAIGTVSLGSGPALPPPKSTATALLAKVRAGRFAKNVDLGRVAAAVAARSRSRL